MEWGGVAILVKDELVCDELQSDKRNDKLGQVTGGSITRKCMNAKLTSTAKGGALWGSSQYER